MGIKEIASVFIEQNKKRALQENALFKKRLITIDLVKQKIWETDIGSKSGGREFNCSIIDLEVPDIKKSENPIIDETK